MTIPSPNPFPTTTSTTVAPMSPWIQFDGLPAEYFVQEKQNKAFVKECETERAKHGSFIF